jgi:aarF domain-containing kinase
MYAASLSRVASKSVTPIVYPATRRWSTQAVARMTGPSDATKMMRLVTTWQRNFGRLYARYILNLAAASAAASITKAKMDAAVDKPSRWKDWSQTDWEETAMESLGNSKIERLWMAVRRVVTLGALTSPLAVLIPLSYLTTKTQDFTWKYSLWAIEQAGPTWIKLAQWATTRQDLFSPAFCQYFGKLRDDTEGHSWKETLKILDQELGDHGERTIKLDPKPIGSGCIAQVYKGTLLHATNQYPVNTEVAVKVQHPGIWHKVCVDFYVLHKLAKFLEGIPSLGLEYLSLSDTVRQFRDVMLPQLDLTLEASHLNRFHQDFINDDKISFPRPLQALTTPQVLTETFVDGTPIMEYVTAPAEERHELARLGLQTTLKMVFLNDFVHGDLHPGNILVSGKHPKLKMHMLDCGLVLEMGPEQHVNLVKVLGAFTRRNGRMAGQFMVDMTTESQASPESIETFIRGIEQIIIMDDDQVSLKYGRGMISREIHSFIYS